MEDGLTIVAKLQKLTRDKLQETGDILIGGGVDSMEKYKYMLGQVHTYQLVLQEISNLLENKEQKDEKGTVIDLKRGPKLKTALLDKIEAEKKPEVDLSKKEESKLPEPTGWRLLVLPFKMKTKTKGGLYLGQETLERQQVGSNCGMVLKLGSHCYDKERYPEGPWCKKGDWVVFARYAGSRIQIDGGEVRLLNDDEILATIQDPEDIFHQY